MKKRALISVSDKGGVVEFARGLTELGFDIVSTGGTARALAEAEVEVLPVSEVTGAPEILGGRVKTLHPKVHGGILADRENGEHIRQVEEQGIVPVDLVCINLYPFEEAVAGGASEEVGVENIDIGGPAMLRAAAKNFNSVIAVPSPEFYADVLEMLGAGGIPLKIRRRLALAAFTRTAAYDAAISGWLEEDDFPEAIAARHEKILPLRYGENPHQEAAYYASNEEHLLSGVKKLQGKDLSFNNLYDLDAARTMLADLMELDAPAAAVIVKHANPCGAAVGGSVAEAYRKAFECDPTSAFGGIVALSGEVDGKLAREISEIFTEVLAAPGFTDEARETLSAKPNARVLEAGKLVRPARSTKNVTGGFLLQETDRIEDDSEYRVVTDREPSTSQREDLLLAWRVAKGVKSNAIVLVKDGATVGVGAGQMSRVDSASIAVEKAGERAGGSVAASDAFFPFADGVEALAKAGVEAFIQPGGSKRDGEVIEVAERYGAAMVFTGRRHFLH